jgi:hypothetical protein
MEIYGHESKLTWASCCYALPATICHFIFNNVFECEYLGNEDIILLFML